MRGDIIAKRYARAFAKHLRQDPQVGQKHLMALSSVKGLFAVEDARKVLASPVMPPELKRQLLDYALEMGKADEVVRKFIYTIVEARRVELIPAIISAFEELLNEWNGRIKALVTSAVPLANEELEVMQANLQDIFRKKIDVRTEVDPNILGGFVVRIGHTLIDLSIKSRLTAITNSAAL